jgi:HD-like signal output (HDOD) protein
MISTTAQPGTAEITGRLVVVDDEPGILASLRSLFHHRGFDASFFSSAQEALGYLQNHGADIIVTDLRMPLMSGQEFLARAMAVRPEASRFIVSGYEDREVVMDILASGVAQRFIHKPWKDQELLGLISETLTLRAELRTEELLKIITSLPTLPAATRSTMHLATSVSKMDVSVLDLVDGVEQEPALVAKLLRVANSVYFGARTPIIGIRDAITFIGTEYVVGLMLGYQAFQNISRGIPGSDPAAIDALWKRAVHRAHIAKTLALNWPNVRNPHIPYSVALLQDIGFVVWACVRPDQYQQFVTLRKESRLTWRQAEEQSFIASHEEVGYRLLQSWNFPERFVTAVGNHHGVTKGDALLSIVQLADVLESGEPTLPHDPELDAKLKELLAHPLEEV